MRKISFLALLCAAAVGLSACDRGDRADTYNYLLMHPHVLKLEMNTCQKQTQIGDEPTAHCAIVDKAASQIMALIEDQQKNPEKFGQDVLRMQFDYMATEQSMIVATTEAANLRAKQASAKEIATAEAVTVERVNELHEIKEKIQIALAVIGLSSPE